MLEEQRFREDNNDGRVVLVVIASVVAFLIACEVVGVALSMLAGGVVLGVLAARK